MIARFMFFYKPGVTEGVGNGPLGLGRQGRKGAGREKERWAAGESGSRAELRERRGRRAGPVWAGVLGWVWVFLVFLLLLFYLQH